jgi:type II secretory pathway pseudopilin PulG
MAAHLGKTGSQKAIMAFTLVEVVMSIAILALVMAGMIYGYVQTNNRAIWSSMSLVAQSLVVASVEQARAAKWNVYTSSGGSDDELPPGTYTNIFTNAVLVPSTGATMTVTNILQITTVTTLPPVRQIYAHCWWKFPPNGQWFTNSVIMLRGGS